MPGSVLPAGDDARVLVVDDDPAMRQAVCELLRMAGLLVVAEAGSAHEALELVDRAAPSVVVVDLRVRRSGTFGLLTLLHKLGSARPAVRVVVHTAVNDVQLHEMASALGAFVVLVKGGSGAALVAAVRTAHATGRAAGNTGAGG